LIVSNELKAIEYLRKNIGDTNIPEGWYENEISDMMQEYADSRPTEPKEDNCTCGAQHGTIDGDQKCTDGCLNNNPEPKTKIAEGLKAFAWTKQGNTSLLDLVDDEIILHQPTEKIERNSIDCVLDALLAICDEATK